MRNGHPYSYIDLERDPVQSMLDTFHIAASEIPVVTVEARWCSKSSNQQIANCLGFNESVDETKVRDLVVIGGGPLGWLLQYMVLQKDLTSCSRTGSPVGKAGPGSRIENYLGLPTGISGQNGRSWYIQAQKFGTEILIAKATRLTCDRKPYVIEVESGVRISARTW